MAKAKSNGNGRLEEAIALLLQNQASLLARVSETDREMVGIEREMLALRREKIEIDRQIAETRKDIAETNRRNDERFARIEKILLEHSRILQALPDMIRDKIGFKTPGEK